MGLMQNNYRMVKARIMSLFGKRRSDTAPKIEAPRPKVVRDPFKLRTLFSDVSGSAARPNRYIKGFNRIHEETRRRQQIATRYIGHSNGLI